MVHGSRSLKLSLWRRRGGRPDNDREVIPNLAIEVVSPTELFNEVLAKKNEYLELGVEQVWVVVPASNEIHVWSAANQCQVLKIGDELDGGDLLPGFRLALASLFNRQPA